jgi:hypothetical protein
MRAIGLLFLACAAVAQAPSYQVVGSVSQIMLSMSWPMSDELLYIERNPPKTDKDWTNLQYAALMLAESGNSCTNCHADYRPGYRRRPPSAAVPK